MLLTVALHTSRANTEAAEVKKGGLVSSSKKLIDVLHYLRNRKDAVP